MSKKRKTVGVDIDVRSDGALWVWVVYDKERSTNCFRDYRARETASRARILKRARQMQDIITRKWEAQS